MNQKSVAVLTRLPLLTRRSRKAKSFGRFSIQRPSRLGNVPAQECKCVEFGLFKRPRAPLDRDGQSRSGNGRHGHGGEIAKAIRLQEFLVEGIAGPLFAAQEIGIGQRPCSRAHRNLCEIRRGESALGRGREPKNGRSRRPAGLGERFQRCRPPARQEGRLVEEFDGLQHSRMAHDLAIARKDMTIHTSSGVMPLS